MSALRDLVYGKGNRPWPYFSEKFPIKTEIIGSDNLRETLEKTASTKGLVSKNTLPFFAQRIHKLQAYLD